ncbi:hypothetical protein SAMN05216404_11925 [Nitrosospira multiformis]|uniref:Uncharacterized protein n=1 Tax=Nitrosospira multiformis TaxID=1231 RepID=A0A1H8P604_9PROT|nr:hypothetical protein [Nitrosospira multiformis]SEO37237.1 hypothetical protein SAMN05216404_11925 [Nitrosospira multiformis]
MSITSYIEQTCPPSPEREEVLTLVRLGLSFQKQQRIGKRPGFLKGYLQELLPKIEGPITFDRLLHELELEAARRDMYGEEESPIEKVDRVWETVVYHHPKTGRQLLSFKSIRNKLSWCKANQ